MKSANSAVHVRRAYLAIRRFRPLRFAVFGTLSLPGCAARHGILDAAGFIADAQRDHLISIALLMTIVTIPLFVALPIILWNYRQSNKTSAYKPDWEYSRLLESLVWGLPALVVCMLGYNLWRESFALDPYRPLESNRAPIEIDAIGLDWKWVFIYPDANVASVNEVVFPVGRPVRFRVTSGTVLQSFMIPRLGGQIYAMPGMVTEINLMTASTGVYRGLNTQFNGEGFARQKFAAKAVSAEDYHRWIAETTQKAPPLDARAMKTLRAQSVLAAPQRYGSVTGHLFDRLVAELQSTDTARVNEHETSPP